MSCSLLCCGGANCAGLPLERGGSHPFHPLVDDGGKGHEKAFLWAAPCAKGCTFAYHPEPCITLLFNDLEYNVDAFVVETAQNINLVAGLGYASLKCRHPVDNSKLRSLTLQITIPSSMPGQSVLLNTSKIKTNSSHRLVKVAGVLGPGGRTAVKCIKDGQREATAFTLHHIETAQAENPVQWIVGSTFEKRNHTLLEESQEMQPFLPAAGLRHENADALDDIQRREQAVLGAKTVIVAFKGSNSLLDMVIDAGGVPVYVRELDGLRVHGSMWAALHTSAKSTAEQVLEALLPFVQRRSREPIDFILTGHSAGGGYAMLVALELFARGRAKSFASSGNGGIGAEEPTDVCDWRYQPLVLTFGAPMVIIPDQNNAQWRDLNERAYLFIHAWDVVPRMPSAEKWLFQVMPSWQVAGLAPWGNQKMVERHLRPAFGHLENFDTCGTMVFLDVEKPGNVMCVASLGSGRFGEHRQILDASPPVLGTHVIKHHDMRQYERATEQLPFETAWRERHCATGRARSQPEEGLDDDVE